MSGERASFDQDGFKCFRSALDTVTIERLRGLFGDDKRPGVRLDGAALESVADLLGRDGVVGQVAQTCLNRSAFAVRAIIFDKTADANWSLDWHQDRTIAVAARVDLEGFGPWTVKQGLVHVQPPQSVIESMVTLRVHLDDVAADNAPLRVVPGSHRLGRIAEYRLDNVVDDGEPVACLAQAGDVWVYKTAIVHASSAASAKNGRRRVLQLDYADHEMTQPLEWAMRI